MKSALNCLSAYLKPYLLTFLLIELAVRAVLISYQFESIGFDAQMIGKIILGGFISDLSAFAYFTLPLGLVFWLTCKGKSVPTIMNSLVFFLFFFIMLFTSASEYFFWDEFQSRFNFIAVDYLVYTQEVVGNIMESYPIFPILAVMGAISLAATFGYKKFSRSFPAPAARHRIGSFVICLLMVAASYQFAGLRPTIRDNCYADEIRKSGIYEFFSAFRNNELEYDRFYITQPQEKLTPILQKNVGITSPTSVPPLDRFVSNKDTGKKYNLVYIVVESLSADYMARFGNKRNLTPNLDKLAKESLFIENLYATGTRTVYGLSATNLSIPPIPGNSIVRRPDNGRLFSMASILNQQGYSSKFIYGGYGYFDNMNTFFKGNGYQIVDRNNLSKEEIGFANVWGVADEYLFSRLLRENDMEYAAGKPFFSMVMTTSNHRPFTYPDGRIDIPSKSGRYGGVKYTDYALHKFLEEAKQKPWFSNTVFVIVADHTAGSAGKEEIDPDKYHIPCFIYAPDIVKPGIISGTSSQIDVPPTVLSVMGIDYSSRFYGVDLTQVKPDRAFLSNYQKLGYLKGDNLLVLKPVRQVDYFKRQGDDFVEDQAPPEGFLTEALSYYQSATLWRGWNKTF